ncbi:MAG: IclR family transcriptional regulator [Candidatus Rokuibacteriota bacterium]|nr:MAG: IclR family transcriptional regulator [Candidatus Rokubacteria bacterium]
MTRVLRSVNNALAVLESFSVERPELGVTELSQALGLGKSTVHRLLTSLAARGYVRKNPQTERYCLGFKAFEVGSLAAGRGAIREIVAPFLRSLMLASKETVHLGVLDEGDVVYIDKIESDQPLQMYSRIGRRAPLHCTALGKALLAWEPKESVERFLRRRLRAYTPSTRTDPDLLRQELAKIRASRHALDEEEFAVGLKCVAAPLFDHTRRAVASLGIAGPAVRLSDERLPRLTSLVREAAGGASRALGGDLNS